MLLEELFKILNRIKNGNMFNKKKPKSTHFGALPINARINISYKNPEKPVIRFGYPHKKEQQKQGLADHGFHSLIFLVIFVLISCGLYLFIYSQITEQIPYPQNCSVNFTYTNTYQGLVNGSVYYKSNKTIKGNQIFDNSSFGGTGIYNRTLNGMNVSCDNFNQSFAIERLKFKYNNPILITISEIFSEKFIPGFRYNISPTTAFNSFSIMITALAFYALAMGWMFLFLFLDKYIGRFLLKFKWYQKFFPKFNALGGKSYYKIIKEVPANKIVELPLFKNVFLDYKAKGEFSKYLERVEIREHPFSKGIFKKGKLYKKKGNNYMIWYAKFYFKEIPKTGELIIWWR